MLVNVYLQQAMNEDDYNVFTYIIFTHIHLVSSSVTSSDYCFTEAKVSREA